MFPLRGIEQYTLVHTITLESRPWEMDNFELQMKLKMI